jgi:hypothetical protein
MNTYHLKRWSFPPITWNKEQAWILLTLGAFLWSPHVLRMADATAAPLDAGILSAIIMAILAFLIFKALTWWLIQHIWPVLGNYSKEQFEANFKALIPWQKVIIYLLFYLLLLFGLVATLATIL